ncbi:ATP-binding protein [Sphingobacterium oryzagri]|uniref:histidine kinase n=1 Tax=Sphingobacterium oryzagri TaxID=3025669 RepID=A0ABY7WDY9_9SPHI|nr:ATP-binding protein [Sphingobacterium sp. KACC 22765]WDF67095.1 ATP-binding protein [Sphingobacterium sp. KACC 22765]
MQKYTSAHFSSIFDQSIEGICIINPDNELIYYCNASFKKQLNKSDHNLIGQNYVSALGCKWRVSPLLLQEILLNDSQLKRTLIGYTESNDSREYKLQTTYSGLALEDNLASWLVISIEFEQEILKFDDTTDFSRALNPILELAKTNMLLNEVNIQLKESQDNLQSAFEAGNLGHCGIDFVTGEVTLSEKGRNFFGLSESVEVTWEALLAAVNLEYHEMVNKAFEDALKLGKPVDSTYSITNLISGEIRWLRVLAKVHFNSSGEPIKLFGLVMDITEEKNDEQRKNDFIAMVSHELKTPLAAAQGYIQLIHRAVQQSGITLASNLAEKAVTQLGRMSKLINGFLNVSRLESGKIDIHPERFKFKELIAEVVEDALATITSHAFSFDECPDVEIYADRDKIQQVLNNLISNAVKYSAAGTNIRIICEQGGAFLKIQVIDQGIGMAPETLHLVFDRFYRIASTPTKNISGFGIGLYICKEIVDRHRGTIWAESTPGKGTAFSFTLPLK